MNKLLFLLAIPFALMSCASTEYVHISVLQPAPVTLPPYMKNVTVLNRSMASEKTKLIDVVEKAVTLETGNLDKEGAESSIQGLADELSRNNRFQHVELIRNTNIRTNSPGRFPAPLDWTTVDSICESTNADGLFAMELFDTDTRISYAVNKVSLNTPLGNIPGFEHQANMETVVKTGWRIYDPSTKSILDEFPISGTVGFTGRGINPIKAAEALTGRKEAVKQAGNTAGHDYATRIIPIWIRVTRDYFVRGNSTFRIARRKAQTGNWDGAAAIWREQTKSADRNVAGRAHYNMAIISEINGDIEGAIKWASLSYENYGNKTALHYLNLLRDRRRGQAILEEQRIRP